jgi:hypothetical protein
MVTNISYESTQPGNIVGEFAIMYILAQEIA